MKFVGVPKRVESLPEAKPAQDDDFGKEYLSLILAIKVVKDMDQAMEHIETYGSRHTESILTNDYSRALRFLTTSGCERGDDQCLHQT